MTARLNRTLQPSDGARPLRTDEQPGVARSNGRAQPLAGWAYPQQAADAHYEPLSLRDALGARYETTPYGKLLVADTRFPLASNHGQRRIGCLFERQSQQFEHLSVLTADARLNRYCPKQTLFIDIEASGLRHGAGVYAFVVGVGFYEASSSSFMVRQFVLDEPSSEQAMLHALTEHIDRFAFLASFNGKSYDLTVLVSRLIAQRFYTRRECDLKLRPHLDLVHLCRTLYRGCWADSKLQTLERNALGFERSDDVPGSLVPSCWYHYLRTGDSRPVAEVVKHNLYDVLSMVTLADRVTVDTAPAASVSQASVQTAAIVQANAGRLWLRRGRPEIALSLLCASLAQGRPQSPGVDQVFKDAVTSARRVGNESARKALLHRWCHICPESERAWTARAIFYERGRKNLSRALAAAVRAHRICPSVSTEKRVNRLQKKTQKLGGFA